MFKISLILLNTGSVKQRKACGSRQSADCMARQMKRKSKKTDRENKNANYIWKKHVK